MWYKHSLSIQFVNEHHNQDPFCDECKERYKQQIQQGINMAKSKDLIAEMKKGQLDPVAELAAIAEQERLIQSAKNNLSQKFIDKLAMELGAAAATMRTITDTLKQGPEFLETEQFKEHCRILHIAIKGATPATKATRANKGDGGPRYGRQINDAFKAAGDYGDKLYTIGLTDAELVKASGHPIEIITGFFTGEKGSRYELKNGKRYRKAPFFDKERTWKPK